MGSIEKLDNTIKEKKCPFIKQKNYLSGKTYADKLHEKAVDSIKCNDKQCFGSFLSKIRPPFVEKTREERIDEAIDFIKEYYESINELNSENHQKRLKEILDSIDQTGLYDLTIQELIYGTKTAWRNASRCPGRIFWSQLKIIDARDKTTAKEMFKELCDFLKLSSEDKSNIKILIIVFPQRKSLEREFRVWNSQLISYAGYEIDENTTIGDKAQVEFTRVCQRLGWKGKGTEYDVLPLVLQADGQEPEMFELPPELVLEVPLSHPKYDFASLNMKYFPVVSFSTFLFDIGGCQFSCAPFSAYYSAPEIARALGDSNRFNKIKSIAEVMNLNTSNNTSLWKDKALIELNYSILYSWQKANVSVIDHHTISEQFLRFFETEHKLRGGCPADWIWINPQMSAHLEDAFHLEMINYKLRPSIEYQIQGWQIKDELNKLKGIKTKSSNRLKPLFLANFFSTILMKKTLEKRVKCTILYATETKKSELFANNLVKLFNYSFNSKVLCMNEYDITKLKNESFLVIVTSTYGNGDPPSNGETFKNGLMELKAKKSNDFKDLRYCVFALGSSTFPNFCEFGKFVDVTLKEIGAKRILNIGLGDDELDQENTFKTWSFEAFNHSLNEFSIDQSKLDSSIQKFYNKTQQKTRWTADIFKIAYSSQNKNFDLNDTLSVWHKRNFVECVKKEKRNLHQSNSEKTVILVKLVKNDGILEYKPGDHIGVIPNNRKELVDAILERTNFEKKDMSDQYIKINKFNKNLNSWETDVKYPKFTIRQALTNFLDITTPLKQHIIPCLIEQASSLEDKEKLKILAQDKDVYESWKKNKFPNLAEILEEFPSIKFEPSFLVVELPKLQPRFYSASSWPKINSNNEFNFIDLTLGVVEYQPKEGQHKHYGVCSKWFDQNEFTSTVPLFIREAKSFHLPENDSTPIIMVGTGTGIAPFRSFWQKRFVDKRENKNFGEMHLYFGCRHANCDDYFQQELDQMLENNVLKSVRKAWSRDCKDKKVYVQDLLEQDAEKVFDLIYNKQAYFYVCGDIKMADHVKTKLIKIITEQSKMNEDQVNDFIKELKTKLRYREDIYGVHV